MIKKRDFKSVHDAHCCTTHGCKYGDEDCPVVLGLEGGIECEQCEADEHDPDKIRIKELEAQVAELTRQLKEISEFAVGGKW